MMKILNGLKKLGLGIRFVTDPERDPEVRQARRVRDALGCPEDVAHVMLRFLRAGQLAWVDVTPSAGQLRTTDGVTLPLHGCRDTYLLAGARRFSPGELARIALG